MLLALGLFLQLQQPATAPTTPPSRDTVGYWQQHVAYTIVATLDEARQRLHGVADLVYVNRSPSTLREMYFHQYLNAFRPGSKWSEVDEREGRDRFGHLADPDYGYERFTAVPTFDGTPVSAVYPGSPDSTVVRFTLPRPLAPGDSVRVHMEWDARPSTVLRRQGRRGRTWDFAQWYPKVAVYDRAGWEPNALQPSGELYGEYGDYDVTTVVRDDQVLAATGVPVAGDPGWARVSRSGDPYIPVAAYDSLPPAPSVTPPDGYRAVRFIAHDVHHFAWSASPDYRYEGATFVRQIAPTHYRTWDTVAVNVLYKPGDDTTWGGGRAVGRTLFALRWLESIWGPYAYPAFTNVHRLEGGGTEFPMMIMDGGASQSLILHEGGHVFTYGILGNNEWRSGWMDEGLTSYQTAWALDQTRPEELRSTTPPEPRQIVVGYRSNAVTMTRAENAELAQTKLDLMGRAQPIGTNAGDFSEFGIYNAMIYGRAELMYGQLRDALGDTAFRAFFHDYYDRWALKHVDELAMRTSAERASGKDLGWFFEQWVRGTGVLDYALTGARSEMRANQTWKTYATIERRGEYRHPMPVGVRTASGWTIARGDAMRDVQTVEIETASQPLEVRLDPLHTTWDWDRRDDVPGETPRLFRDARLVYDWPFLDQSDRDRTVVALSAVPWYSDPNGLVLAARARSNYLGLVDRWDRGIGYGMRNGRLNLPGDTLRGSALSRLQLWARVENPTVPWGSRPMMGQSFGAAFLDGILKLDWSWTRDVSRFVFARAPRVSTTIFAAGTYPTDRVTLPEQWDYTRTTEAGFGQTIQLPADAGGGTASGSYLLSAGLSGGQTFSNRAAQPFARFEGQASYTIPIDSATVGVGRAFVGGAFQAPMQRSIFLSSLDPYATFMDHWFRPRGSILKQSDAFVPLGGAELHGFSPLATARVAAAANAELRRRLTTLGGFLDGLSVWGAAFGDVGLANRLVPIDPAASIATGWSAVADGGAGVSLRGRLYDRDVALRLDLPVFVSSPQNAVGRSPTRHPSLALRWELSW